MWQGVPLAQLEGQNFQMIYEAMVTSRGLKITMSVVSDKDSVVGIHYYWRLPNGQGKVVARVQDTYIDGGVVKPIPKEWIRNDQMEFDLTQAADFTFHPAPDPLRGNITLETSEYLLEINSSSLNQENCWQLFHPAGSSYVCIEPLSAQDPRHPNLTVSSINIEILVKTTQ